MASPPKPSNLCFKCKKSGHWYKDCPENAKRLSLSSSSSSSSLQDVPVVRCPCGHGACKIIPSHTKKNPGRMFYSCCQILHKCGFFQWVDEVVEVGAPLCPCGAGVCSLNRDENGCWFFACKIKKGHGACSFFRWADSRVNRKMNKYLHRSTGCFSTQDENSEAITKPTQSPRKDSQLSSEISEDHSRYQNYNGRQNDSESSLIFKNFGQGPLNILEDESLIDRENMNKYLHRSTECFSTQDENSEAITKPTQSPKKDSQLSSGISEDHSRYQNYNIKQNDYESSLIFRNFGQSPLNILEDESLVDHENMNKYLHRSTGCFSTQDENSEAITKRTQNPRKDSQLSSGISEDHSRCQNYNRRQNDSESSVIFKNFGQRPLNILEDESLVDRETMLTSAETTFSALRSLSINISSFSEHVMKYIDCKSRLVTLQNSMCIFQRFGRQLTERKAEYEAVLGSHFSKEFSCMKNGSHNLQEELERSQAKILELKTSLLKIECEMSVSKRRMEVAWQEMNEAISMEKETNRLQHEAKTTLKSAKAELSSESNFCVNKSFLVPVKNAKYAVFYVYALVPVVAFALYSIGLFCLGIKLGARE